VAPDTWTTLSFTARDADGWNDAQVGLTYIEFLLNDAANSDHACDLVYYPRTRQIGLVMPYQLLTMGSGTAANSYCTLDAGGSSVTTSTTDVTVNARVKFSMNMLNHLPMNGYMHVVDAGNMAAGWTQLTSNSLIAVPPAAPSLIGPVNGSSNRPVSLSLSWAQSPGAAAYDVYLGTTSPPPLVATVTATSYTPPALTAGVAYFWCIVARNSAGPSAPSPTWFFQTAPAGGSLLSDGWRIGVRPTGSYWGAAGEQIDLLSGNLSFSIPLLHAQARGGWGVDFRLSYNSQIWRQGTAGSSLLGRDIGYGLGWVLQAGSVAPNADGRTYIYSDASGAQYRLDRFSNGVYTSLEGPRVAFDTNVSPPQLHFPDGSFWVLGSVSAAGEPDAGTLYATLMEDSNGNQIVIDYAPGAGASATNTSGRLIRILDARAQRLTSGYSSYTFTYNSDPIPHLVGVTASIPTGENYSFTYEANQTLVSPFGGSLNFGVTTLLRAVTTQYLNISHTFQYVPGSAELSQTTTPLGGVLGWQYRNYVYGDGHMYREVQTRTMQPGAGGPTYTWNLALDSNPVLHGSATMSDLGAGTAKVWTFQPSGSFAGLANTYEERDTNNAVLMRKEYTWALDPSGVAYIGAELTTWNPGSAYAAQTKTTQTLDAYGNLLQLSVYDYGNLSTPARIYSYTYLTDASYTSRYIRNRLRQVSISNIGVPVLSITYDSDSGCGPLRDRTEIDLHDAAYGVNFLYRGNPTSVTQFGTTHCYAYEITGVPYLAKDGTGKTVDISLTANASLPGVLTPNGNNNLATTITYASSFAVTSVSGPNGATTTTDYDAFGRPLRSTISDGAVTNYTYTYNPTVQTATLGNRWKKTTVDGFGRVIKVETGHDGVTVSTVETQYAPCACSPLGKVWRVSQPYAPGAPVNWTTYSYDGSGRTLTVTAPDGSVTKYEYRGNQTTVTDPAGKWKAFTNDAMGNLVSVAEPNPAGGANLVTNYTYTGLNQLWRVTMPRAEGTQTRTFSWSGFDLSSATNPENGTVTYQYDSEHRVTQRTDAKGQQTLYSYDAYGRLTQKRYFAIVNQILREQPDQEVDYYYDTNPLDGGYSEQAWGRLTAVTFGNGYSYQYSYNQAGRVIKQKLRLPDQQKGQPVEFEAQYGWDNEGRMTSLSYPARDALTAGPQYNYQFDAMGRVSGMTLGSGNQAVGSVAYGAAGELLSLNGDTRTYNVLGQLTRILGGGIDVEYLYPAGRNNGRIVQQIDHLSGEQITYQYDELNRLTHAEAADGSWSSTYGYDGFGNLTRKVLTLGNARTEYAWSYDPATNQGAGCDANGNAPPAWSCYGCPPNAYDVENRLVISERAYTANVWVYDPWGKRVGWRHPRSDQAWDHQESECEVNFYGIMGRELATYRCGYHDLEDGDGSFYWSLKGYRVYLGGELIEEDGVSVKTDRLGSVRVNGKGERFHYLPYGEEYPATVNGRVKFGTYFRDSSFYESSTIPPSIDPSTLYYADQRYYASNSGRFLTPDPTMDNVDYSNPTSWNMYAYVNGDPVNFNDPEGTDCSSVHLAGWAGIPNGTTVGDFLAKNSDLSIFAETVFSEARIGWDDDAAYEKAAIAATVMNRWQIVNGYYDLYTRPVGTRGAGKVRTIPDWGQADGTIGSIVWAKNQFAVWGSPGNLKSGSQDRLDQALSDSETSNDCISLLQSIGTVAGFWAARNDHTMYASANGTIFTSFGLSTANESSYETEIGRFGSSNIFFGVSQ
jgi:RHS repeat-associated protein